MIVQVFKQCDKERSTTPYVETQDAHTRTSAYTGVWGRQVVNILKYYKDTNKVPPLTIVGNQTVHETNIKNSVEASIRQFILDRDIRGEICNANHIQDFLNEKVARNGQS